MYNKRLAVWFLILSNLFIMIGSLLNIFEAIPTTTFRIIFLIVLSIEFIALVFYLTNMKKTIINTKRLKLYAASQKQMEAFIAAQTVDALKEAYTEMLNGCLSHPKQWALYAIWMIELKDGTHIGELCFKGLSEDGTTEIGYGIAGDYQGHGYATEAVSALVNWVLEQPGVLRVMAETEASNLASQKVLNKAGFKPTGETGKEGPLYLRTVDDSYLTYSKFLPNTTNCAIINTHAPQAERHDK